MSNFLKVLALTMMASVALGVGATARAVMYFSPDSQDVTAVAWSPDGTYILSSGFEGTIRLWQANTCNSGPFIYINDPRLREGDDGYGPLLAGVMSVAWSPNGSRFVAGLRDRTVRLFEINPKIPHGQMFDEIEVFSHEDMGGLRTVTFNPNSRLIAAAGHDRAIRIWEAKKRGSMTAELKGHEDRVESIAFSSDGSTLISGSYDGTVRLWDMNTNQERQRLVVGRIVTSVVFSSDNRLVAALVSPDDPKEFAIFIWNTTTGEMVRKFGTDMSRSQLTQLALSPDGIHLATGNLEDGIIRIWNIETGRPEQELTIPEGRARGLSFSPNGRYVVAGISGGAPIIWNVETGQLIQTLGRCTQH